MKNKRAALFVTNTKPLLNSARQVKEIHVRHNHYIRNRNDTLEKWVNLEKYIKTDIDRFLVW